jgi:hypothetical protein
MKQIEADKNEKSNNRFYLASQKAKCPKIKVICAPIGQLKIY